MPTWTVHTAKGAHRFDVACAGHAALVAAHHWPLEAVLWMESDAGEWVDADGCAHTLPPVCSLVEWVGTPVR